MMGWLNRLKKQFNQTKSERFQEEFRQFYTQTLTIDELDTVHIQLMKQLHIALHPEYMEKVNTAFRLKFPRLSQQQVNVLWRELKKYFVLTAVFKQVDMFHSKVDELWHTMLEYKNEYDQFCQTFIGQSILHNPHIQPTHLPTERTLFDFYYVQLFTVNNDSIKIWGKFFKEDKGLSFVQAFTTNELGPLKQTYMRIPTSEYAEQTFEVFAAQIKQLQENPSVQWKKTYKQTNNASIAYFTYVGSDDDSDKDFKDIFGPDSTDSTSSHHHDHSDSGSDTSSCSSCSSCSSS